MTLTRYNFECLFITRMIKLRQPHLKYDSLNKIQYLSLLKARRIVRVNLFVLYIKNNLVVYSAEKPDNTVLQVQFDQISMYPLQ